MFTSLECVVLSPSLYMLIKLFSSFSVNSSFIYHYSPCLQKITVEYSCQCKLRIDTGKAICVSPMHHAQTRSQFMSYNNSSYAAMQCTASLAASSMYPAVFLQNSSRFLNVSSHGNEIDSITTTTTTTI